MSELFDFSAGDVKRHIEYELKTFSKVKEPFNYVVKRLIERGNSITITDIDKVDLNSLKEDEGKSYNWSVIQYENLTFIVRRYGKHLTFYTQIVDKRGKDDRRTNYNYGAFMLETDMDKFVGTDDEHDGYSDMLYEAPFTEFNKLFKPLVDCIKHWHNTVHGVSNGASLPTPKHLEFKVIYDRTTIHSYDKFFFAMEEITQQYLTLFAETTLLKQLDTLKDKIGLKFSDDSVLKSVKIKVKDGYYHGVGMTVVKTFRDESEDKWSDVYCIARYHLDRVFPTGVFIYRGDAYIHGEGEPKSGDIVITKGKDKYFGVFQETYPDDTWSPLVKL